LIEEKILGAFLLNESRFISIRLASLRCVYEYSFHVDRIVTWSMSGVARSGSLQQT